MAHLTRRAGRGESQRKEERREEEMKAGKERGERNEQDRTRGQKGWGGAEKEKEKV